MRLKPIQNLTRRGKIGEAFSQAENAVVFFGSEGLGQEGSTALAAACGRALHETGHTGRPNNGLIGVWDYANHQGAAEIGFEPAENLQTAFDRAAAVYIVGADPIGDGAITPKSGRRRPFVLVQDLFETETARAANVVLPAQTYMERDGSFTSGERRVQRFHAAISAPEGTKPDFAITAQVARASGVILEGSSASVVFDIMAAEEDSPFTRLSYERLAEVQEQWPIVGRGDLYYGGTTYDNTQGMGVQLLNAAQRGKKVGMPRLRKVASLRPKEKLLLGVPVTKLYDRARTVASADALKSRIGEAFVAMHPSAARESRAGGRRSGHSQPGRRERASIGEDRCQHINRRGAHPTVDGLADQCTDADPDQGRPEGRGEVGMDPWLWLEWFLKALVMLLILLTGFAYLTWYERHALARIQTRVGPNRAGPQGLLQPIADAVKLIFKEELTPSAADKVLFVAAPIMTVVPAMILMAVIPLGTQFTLPFTQRVISLNVASINVGVLYLTAIASISVYGIVLAGWASNNKYAMLGGMRSTAQMISYELALGLCFVLAILLADSMNLVAIVEAQKSVWFAVLQPVGALVFMVTTLAEVNRAPFDMPEAEQELAAGYHSEYSGMKFALFFMAEYEKMIVISMIAATLYFGGYREFWFLKDTFLSVDQTWWLGPFYLLAKVVVLLFFMIWIRATWPRIRYDRLMAFGWKVLLPISVVLVIVTAAGILLAEQFGRALIWSIPVVSILVGMVAALALNHSLNRTASHA